MSKPADPYTTLLKLVLRHEKINDILLGALTDQACLLLNALDRCSTDDCRLTATVLNLSSNQKTCDHCAASYVVNNKALENEWIDLPDAVRIRRLNDYVDAVKTGEIEHQDVH